jgi:membrane protease YdiL (CAAX protease family)
VALLLAGFPAGYLLNSVSPWSRSFSEGGDPGSFFAFTASLLVLHWLSAGVTLWGLRRSGLRVEDVGLSVSARTGVLLAGLLVATGVAIAASREIFGAGEPLWRGPAAGLALSTRGQQAVWILMSLSAGFCEELVYRGFGISVLRAKGLPVALAVLLPTLSWVLIHGVGGLLMFFPHLVVGLLFAGLFLWRKSLVPVMFVHALVDLSLLGT